MFENYKTIREKDIPILASLRQDARMKLTKMSKLNSARPYQDLLYPNRLGKSVKVYY